MKGGQKRKCSEFFVTHARNNFTLNPETHFLRLILTYWAQPAAWGGTEIKFLSDHYKILSCHSFKNIQYFLPLKVKVIFASISRFHIQLFVFSLPAIHRNSALLTKTCFRVCCVGQYKLCKWNKIDFCSQEAFFLNLEGWAYKQNCVSVLVAGSQ